MCRPPSAGGGFRGGGASLEGLAARSALLWFWEGRRLALLRSRASLLPIPLGCLEGSRNAGAGVCMSPPVCDKGQIPGVLSVPTRPNQGLERSSLQGWKCGFICLGLRCLLTFSGLVLERGARRAGAWWCAGARCLSGCGRWWCQEGPVGQDRVDRGRVQVSNSSTLRSATAQFPQARGASGVTGGSCVGRCGRCPGPCWGGRERSWPFHQERAGELGRRGVSSDSSPGWPRGDLLHVAQAPEECVPLLGAPVVCMAGVSVRCMRWAAQGPAGKRGWMRGRSVW